MDLALWFPFIEMAISLGVRSFTVIRAAAENAGLDDAQIAILRQKWNVLYTDVRRAAGLPPEG